MIKRGKKYSHSDFEVGDKLLPKSKRSQVTVFVIIAIAVVVIVVLFFVFKDRIGIGTNDESEMKKLVQDCFEATSAQGLFLIGQQGGYYNVPENLSTEFLPSIYIIGDQTYLPGKQKIESELSLYITENIDECLNNFEQFPTYEVDFQKNQITTPMNSNEVMMDPDFRLSAQKGDESFLITRFKQVKFQVRLGIIYNAAEQLANQQLEEGICLSCILDIGEANDLIINLIDEGPFMEIFEIVDENSKLNNNPYSFQFVKI